MNTTRDLMKHARARFDAARAALGISASIATATDLDRLDDLASTAHTDAQRITASADLTATAKARRLTEIRSAYDLAAQEITQRISERVEEAETQQRKRLTVPPPDGLDASTRMLAARQDALMVLDRTPDDTLGLALRTLAQDDGDVGRLMLGDWPNRYLQARRDNAAAADFHAVRDQLAADWLARHGITHGADALAALATLPEARKARDVTTFVTRATAEELSPSDPTHAPPPGSFSLMSAGSEGP